MLGTTLLLHHWFGISPGVSEFVIDVICYALGFRFLGKAFFKYAIAASAGFACFYMPVSYTHLSPHCPAKGPRG